MFALSSILLHALCTFFERSDALGRTGAAEEESRGRKGKVGHVRNRSSVDMKKGGDKRGPTITLVAFKVLYARRTDL